MTPLSQFKTDLQRILKYFFFCNSCGKSFQDIREMKMHEKDCDITDDRLVNKPFFTLF